MKTLVYNIGELVMVDGPDRLRQGKDMNHFEIVKDAYFTIENGKFEDIGFGFPFDEYDIKEYNIIDAQGLLVTPGFIDSHTHLVFAGNRAYELEQKANGVSYLEILKNGGGILSTVKDTRSTSFNSLYKKAKSTLQKMIEFGVTTVEAKSGYGLDRDTEIKQLKVSKKLNEKMPISIMNTYMGAHAIPIEYQNNKQEYINLIKNVLEEIKKENLATFCDVFCEDEVFSIEEAKEILEYAKNLGYKLKIHADEIVPLGGAKLAAELNCLSAEHLMATNETDIKELAKEKVVANLLPLTSFYLDKPFAKARLMIDSGCGVAISTDYNPGSNPCENIQLAMQMALLKMKMTPKEVITAVTMNAACSLGIEKKKGSISVGKDADFIIFNIPNLDHFFYHYGINHVKEVYSKGKLIYKKSL